MNKTAEEFFVRELPNGMTLVGQRMEQVASAAMTFLVPGGASHDAEATAGAASVLAEWCLRGAGQRDTRQLNEAMDCLGCQHNETVQAEHVQFTAAQLGRNLPEVVPIYADILRRPRLEQDTFGPCRALVLQDLAALEDEPASKCKVLLREKFYPYPLGRCIWGRAESLRGLTADAVRRHWRGHYGPRGAILAAAGKIDWDRLCDLVEEHFADWQCPPAEPVAARAADDGVTHIGKQTAQSQIALAHRSVPLGHKLYYAARISEMVLSGGTSGRLFAEVREKRGLVYHVSALYDALKDHAGLFTYASTMPRRAQETLDVTVDVLRRLGEGIEKHEMARARSQLKTAVVMQGESTTARAVALASDWYRLGRLRSLAELSQAIDNVKTDQVLEYWQQFPARHFTVLTVGAEPLDTSRING